MIFALNDARLLTEATPNAVGICPHCNKDVISKCGTINIWHWAHKSQKCDFIWEPLSDWHIGWQELALKLGCKIEVNFNGRIADAVDEVHKIIYEFQKSPISQEELKDRSEFYKSKGYKVNWIFHIPLQKKATYDLFQEKPIILHLDSKFLENRLFPLTSSFYDIQPKYGHIFIDTFYPTADYTAFIKSALLFCCSLNAYDNNMIGYAIHDYNLFKTNILYDIYELRQHYDGDKTRNNLFIQKLYAIQTLSEQSYKKNCSTCACLPDCKITCRV